MEGNVISSTIFNCLRKNTLTDFPVLEPEPEKFGPQDRREDMGREKEASNPVRKGNVFTDFRCHGQTMAAFAGLLYARLQCL